LFVHACGSDAFLRVRRSETTISAKEVSPPSFLIKRLQVGIKLPTIPQLVLSNIAPIFFWRWGGFFS